jgi:hypothetical protein
MNMGLPKDFPPVEIIQGLEVELGLPFMYFMVSLEGEIEGLFGNDVKQQVVSFEVKRTSLTEHEMPTFETMMGQMDKEDIASVKDALKDMVSKMEEKIETEPVFVEHSDYDPKYNDWYCP